MRRVWMFLVCLIMFGHKGRPEEVNQRQMLTISGFINDKESGESLIGASVLEAESGRGIATNVYGYYTLKVPAGTCKLRISYIGYKTGELDIELYRDTVVNFDLVYDNILSEIVVTAGKEFRPVANTIELSPAQIKANPVAFGETDVLKALHAVPGIQAGVEGTSGFYVRGGGMDQNLFLLDGVPVYNVGHAMGLFSIFNGEAVKKVTLHKGSFPARFGGRLSSVVDVRLKDGDMYKYHGSFTIGLLSSRVNLEGPLIKGKTSFNFSARRSYIDLFTRAARLFTDEAVPDLFLFDVNAKLNHKFSDKSRLYFSFYKGKDKISSTFTQKYDVYYEKTKAWFDWGNLITSLRWNYIFSNKLFMNTTLAYNRYNYEFKSYEEYKYDDYSGSYEAFQNSGIDDYSINTDFEYFPGNHHQFRFGGGIIFHSFRPEVHGNRMVESDNGETTGQNNNFLDGKIRSREVSLFVEDEFTITGGLKANIGAHFSLFNVQAKTHTSIQPRVSLGYQLNDHWSVKSSYTQMSQYVHLLSSNMLSLPTDLWVPVTKHLKPMSAHQYSLGAYYDTNEGYDFSVEGFYKNMHNLLEYKDGSGWGDAYSSWETLVESGKGRAYGVEFSARKTIGKLTGTTSYTLAWNDRKFDSINRGRRFYAKYDRRHDFNITVAYEFSEKVDLSASWMYASGNNATVPLEEYQVLPDIDSPGWLPGSVAYVESRNNYRLPSTHHLDLNLNYHRSTNRTWSFSIYNLYNRANPYMVFPGYGEKSGRYTLIQYSLLRIVPSVSFTCKF